MALVGVPASGGRGRRDLTTYPPNPRGLYPSGRLGVGKRQGVGSIPPITNLPPTGTTPIVISIVVVLLVVLAVLAFLWYKRRIKG